MDATHLRVRLGPAFEWVVAAAFLLATLIVALLLLRELGAPPAARPAAAASATTASSSLVPEHAVSVPALMLMDGSQLRVGDTAEHVGRILGGAGEIGVAATEPGPLGTRVVRTYERQGTRFLLVLEPFERNGPPRVAGIYLQ